MSKLDNAIQIKFDKMLHEEELGEFLKELNAALDLGGNAKKNLQSLSYLMASLMSAAEMDIDKYVSISLNKNYYTELKALKGSLAPSYTSITKILKALHESEKIELHTGFFDRDTGISRLTRIKLKEDFYEEVWSICDSTPQEYIKRVFANPVSLKVKHKSGSEEVILLNDRQSKKHKDVLDTYNKLLEESLVYLEDEYIKKALSLPDFSNKYVLRTFLDSRKLDKGGRFKGAWWMSQSKYIRSKITIDNKPTIELDYESQYPSLLYALKGLPVPDNIYSIKREELRTAVKPDRKIIKAIFLTAISAKNIDEVGPAIVKSLYKKHERKYKEVARRIFDSEAMEYSKIRDVFYRIKEAHPNVEDLLFQGLSGKLQNIDSTICEYIIQELSGKGIVVLTIHDSFVVQQEHKELLRKTMQDAYVYLGYANSIPKIEEVNKVATAKKKEEEMQDIAIEIEYAEQEILSLAEEHDITTEEVMQYGILGLL